MALIKRTELSTHIEDLEKGGRKAIYLFYGERYLCREAADQLQNSLLGLPGGGAVHAVDGDTEDVGKSLGQLMNFSLLPGLQIFRVTDSRLFHSKDIAETIWSRIMQARDAKKEGACRRQLLSFITLAGLTADDTLSEVSADQWRTLFGFSRPEGDLSWADALLSASFRQKEKRSDADIASAYVRAFEKGIPPGNILILTAEAVDKRKQFFTFIKKEGLAVDCSVAGGASSAARKSQKEILRELVMKSLADFQKKIAPRALELLFERVGFHPVAVVMETEKLALGVGERELITVEDLEAMVGRTREDALFELTDAFGKGQEAKTLVLLNRLLENGVHSLAILATMRNYLRKLLIIRTLQGRQDPVYRSALTAQQFQKAYLPALKEKGEWSDILKGHPYALFISFSKAREFSCGLLKEWLSLLLQAEYRLKGAPLPPRLVLEELFLTMLTGKTEGS